MDSKNSLGREKKCAIVLHVLNILNYRTHPPTCTIFAILSVSLVMFPLHCLQPALLDLAYSALNGRSSSSAIFSSLSCWRVYPLSDLDRWEPRARVPANVRKRILYISNFRSINGSSSRLRLRMRQLYHLTPNVVYLGHRHSLNYSNSLISRKHMTVYIPRSSCLHF